MKKTHAELYEQMKQDLGIDSLYSVPGYLHDLIERLLDSGWRKP